VDLKLGNEGKLSSLLASKSLKESAVIQMKMEVCYVDQVYKHLMILFLGGGSESLCFDLQGSGAGPDIE